MGKYRPKHRYNAPDANRIVLPEEPPSTTTPSSTNGQSSSAANAAGGSKNAGASSSKASAASSSKASAAGCNCPEGCVIGKCWFPAAHVRRAQVRSSRLVHAPCRPVQCVFRAATACAQPCRTCTPTATVNGRTSYVT